MMKDEAKVRRAKEQKLEFQRRVKAKREDFQAAPSPRGAMAPEGQMKQEDQHEDSKRRKRGEVAMDASLSLPRPEGAAMEVEDVAA